MSSFIKLCLLCMVTTLIVSCSSGGKLEEYTVFPSIKDVPESAWEKLSQKKIYFAHQSVGFNIIDGIRDVMKENPQINLNIIETTDWTSFNSGVFAHSKVGKNMDPVSKVDEFVAFIENGIGYKADIAVLKFCYVDITAETQVDNILDVYAANMKQIKENYSTNTIVHFTVPLTRSKTTWKTLIKRIIGRATDYEDNIKRNEYNEKLLNTYKDKEPVFDLAVIESTSTDGKRTGFIRNGKTYYALVTEYTDDGGHLNELGRKVVAEQLLIFLSNLEIN